MELGVCQICGTDAHAIFQEICNISVADRKAVLERTNYIKLPVSSLNKMIKSPKEGMVINLEIKIYNIFV